MAETARVIVPFEAGDPPMTTSEYDAAQAQLDVAKRALDLKYVTSQTYPRWAYHATEPARSVDSDEEALALGEGWSATPVGDEPDPLVVTRLEPDQVALGSPSFTLHVQGTGFALDSVIVWNGSDEPTTVVSATELTTSVNMATAVVAMTLPVAVRTGVVVSNSLPFTFTEMPPLRSAADPPRGVVPIRTRTAPVQPDRG